MTTDRINFLFNFIDPIFSSQDWHQQIIFCNDYRFFHNNDFTNLYFSEFLKEYSIVEIFLKGEFVIKSRCLLKACLAFTPHYHEIPNWYNI